MDMELGDLELLEGFWFTGHSVSLVSTWRNLRGSKGLGVSIELVLEGLMGLGSFKRNSSMSRFKDRTLNGQSLREQRVFISSWKVDLRNVVWGKRSKQSDAKLCLALRRKKRG